MTNAIRRESERRPNGAQTTEVVCALGSRRVRRRVSSPRCTFFFLSTGFLIDSTHQAQFWTHPHPFWTHQDPSTPSLTRFWPTSTCLEPPTPPIEPPTPHVFRHPRPRCHPPTPLSSHRRPFPLSSTAFHAPAPLSTHQHPFSSCRDPLPPTALPKRMYEQSYVRFVFYFHF